MSMLSKAIQSRTTQTVAGSTVAAGSLALTLLGWLRTQHPSWTFWPETMDQEIVVAVTAAGSALLARGVAWWRGKL